MPKGVKKKEPNYGRSRGRPPEPIVTVAQVAQWLTLYKGNVSAVARQIKVTRAAVARVISLDPNLKQVLADSRESMVDDAESMLHAAIADREAWAICFTLKTLGKSRGYIERSPAEQVASAVTAVGATVALQRILDSMPYEQLQSLLPYLEQPADGTVALTGHSPSGNGAPINVTPEPVREDVLEDAKPES